MSVSAKTQTKLENSPPGGLLNSRWIHETLTQANLIKLALISIFLASVDTIQSYYLQRVVNQFSEANLLPLKFYNMGPLGYALYFPIDFLSLFATLVVLWIWASYILWYHRHVIVARMRETTS
ncbi:MAG: hypothetical protein ACHQ1H_06940 [Nitrososphaerales archaeon]